MNNKKKKSTLFKLFFPIISLILLLFLIGGLYILKTLNKVNKTTLNSSDLGIVTDELKDYDNIEKINNIALFSIDTIDEKSDVSNINTILTIDSTNNKLKLTSFLNNTYVYIKGFGDTELSNAYSYGGVETSIKTINENFGLNIDKFISFNFSSIDKIIDILGGVDIQITDSEINYLNESINNLNSIKGSSISNISSSGIQHLNGVQALAYSQIKYSSEDIFVKTERQSNVMNALFKKLASSNFISNNNNINEILPYIQTNLTTQELLSLGKNITNSKNTLEENIFPKKENSTIIELNGNNYVAFDPETTKNQIRNYIFKDIQN